MTKTKCMDVQGKRVVYLCDADSSTSELAGDYLIFALGTKPQEDLYRALQGKVEQVFLVGDAYFPLRIYHAVFEGMMAALKL